MLGLIEDFVPKHARRYADLGATIKTAVSEYAADVRSQSYPSDDESHQMKPEALEQLTVDAEQVLNVAEVSKHMKANAALAAMNFANLLLPLAVIGWVAFRRRART